MSRHRSETATVPPGRLFASVPEVAGILGLDERTVRRAVADGQIPATKVGVRVLIPTAWLRAQAGQVGASATG